MAETAPVDTVESASPAPPQDAPAEKVELANGDHKLENGDTDHVDAPVEAPNAESTPVKSKAKRRQIVANMRAAFARLGLISQLRAFGRRMRRAPKAEKLQQQTPAEQAAPENQENGDAAKTNGILDGATLLAATPAVNGEENSCNGNHVNGDAMKNGNGNVHEEGVENHAAENDEARQSPQPISNDTAEPTAVVAQ